MVGVWASCSADYCGVGCVFLVLVWVCFGVWCFTGGFWCLLLVAGLFWLVVEFMVLVIVLILVFFFGCYHMWLACGCFGYELFVQDVWWLLLMVFILLI